MLAINKKKMRVRDSCERLAARGCVREVRARAATRVLTVALLAYAFVLFCPQYAFGDSVNAQIISGPSAVPFADMYGASIAAPDRYTAAALLMGYGPDAISSWDDVVKAKLSNADTGGNFYYFASNSVQNYFDATEHTGIFQDFFNFVGGTFWNAAQALYGNNLWAALYTSDELAAAKSDLQRVLSGENIGGGGGAGGSGLSCDTSYANQYRSTYNVLGTDGNTYNAGINLPSTVTEMPSTVSFDLSGTDLPSLETSAIDYSYIYQSSSSEIVLEVMHFSSSMQIVSFADGKGLSYPLRFSNPSESTTNSELVRVDYYFTVDSFDGATFSAHYVSSRTYPTTSIRPGSYFQIVGFAQPRFFINGGSSGGGGGDPVVPPTNWPEPNTPEPPELPEPSDPTVDPPEPYDPYEPVVDPPAPYNPTGGDTYIYNITNITEPTDTSSVLEWVKKIFYELKALHSDLSTWVQNLGSALDKLRVTLNNGFTQLYGAIDDVESDIQDVVSSVDNANRQIYNRIGQLGTDLKSEFSSLKQYLRQLFNWLGEKMNFNNEGYDDTSVIYWLKRIWGKLGSGDVNVRPTDPTVNPPAWWEWLNRMLDSLLDGLVGVFNSLLGGTGDLLEEVIHQFPFSIPWDIAAFLTVLAAPPVTPVFDIVIPAIDTWWPEYTIHIDMAPFDTAAATIRLMTKVVFAGCLAWKSRELLDMMDVTKW